MRYRVFVDGSPLDTIYDTEAEAEVAREDVQGDFPDRTVEIDVHPEPEGIDALLEHRYNERSILATFGKNSECGFQVEIHVTRLPAKFYDINVLDDDCNVLYHMGTGAGVINLGEPDEIEVPMEELAMYIGQAISEGMLVVGLPPIEVMEGGVD